MKFCVFLRVQREIHHCLPQTSQIFAESLVSKNSKFILHHYLILICQINLKRMKKIKISHRRTLISLISHLF
jgi:hypothetical protein